MHPSKAVTTAGAGGSCPIVFLVRKQEEIKACAQLTFFCLFSPGPRHGMVQPTCRWAFPSVNLICITSAEVHSHGDFEYHQLTESAITWDSSEHLVVRTKCPELMVTVCRCAGVQGPRKGLSLCRSPRLNICRVSSETIHNYVFCVDHKTMLMTACHVL